MKKHALVKILFLAAAVSAMISPVLLPSGGLLPNIQTADAAAKPYISARTLTLITGDTKVIKIIGEKQKAIWKSSKKSVATVNSKGLITARSAGTARITAKAGDKIYSCTVKTEEPTLISKSPFLFLGDTTVLKLEGTTAKVQWSSSNPQTVSISEKGIATALKEGTAKISATIKNHTYSCDITVENPVINSVMETIPVSTSFQLRVLGTSEPVKWQSTDPSIVHVSDTGLVTGIKSGSTSVFAFFGSKKLVSIITVQEVSLNKTSALIDAGDFTYLSVSGTGAPVTWMSNNMGIAVVDTDGRVTGITAGKTIIFALTGNQVLPCEVTVEKLSLNYTLLNLSVDDSMILTVNGTTRNIEWQSSDTDVADVEADGLVYAYSEGVTTISAIIGGTRKINCVVTVTAAPPDIITGTSK